MSTNRMINNPYCDLCNNQLTPPLMEKDYQTFPCHVAVCPSCGLVKLNPRWSEEKYNNFYKTKYHFFNRSPDETPLTIFQKDLQTKGETIRERLKDVSLPSKIKMLDIGAGTGFAFSILSKNPDGSPIESRDVTGYCIDGSPKFRPFLTSQGLRVISDDFSSPWQGPYDFIVARHVLEHTMDPITFLRKIRDSLTQNGLAYIALPNAMHFSISKADSFFRNVHTYYFNITTFIEACKKAGLYPVKAGSEGELWAVLTARENSFDYPQITPQEQMQLVEKYIRNSKLSFYKRIKGLVKRSVYGAI